MGTLYALLLSMHIWISDMVMTFFRTHKPKSPVQSLYCAVCHKHSTGGVCYPFFIFLLPFYSRDSMKIEKASRPLRCVRSYPPSRAERYARLDRVGPAYDHRKP